MAKLVYGLNQSLDGYVDHDAFSPGPILFRHFIEQTRAVTGSLYGRKMYEIMAFWDQDHDLPLDHQEYSDAWRANPKWVVSRTLDAVGPNATLIRGDLEAEVRKLKAGQEGMIEVAGPDLAQSLTEMGLIDEYQIFLHPVVTGGGTPFFKGAMPPLKLVASDPMGEDVIRLTYVLA